MAAVGGPVRSVSLDGRAFQVAHDSEAQRQLGGFSNELEPNGDGVTSRIIKTIVPWSLDGLTLAVDDERADHEFLQALANGNRLFTVAVAFASGSVYQGGGQIVGELQFSSKNSTAGVSLKGAGQLTKQ